MKGSGISGVTGLRASEGKSNTLGDKISGIWFRDGENGLPLPTGELGLEPSKVGIRGPIILRFLRLPRRS